MKVLLYGLNSYYMNASTLFLAVQGKFFFIACHSKTCDIQWRNGYRLAFSVSWKLDQSGKVLDIWYGRTVIEYVIGNPISDTWINSPMFVDRMVFLLRVNYKMYWMAMAYLTIYQLETMRSQNGKMTSTCFIHCRKASSKHVDVMVHFSFPNKRSTLISIKMEVLKRSHLQHASRLKISWTNSKSWSIQALPKRYQAISLITLYCSLKHHLMNANWYAYINFFLFLTSAYFWVYIARTCSLSPWTWIHD